MKGVTGSEVSNWPVRVKSAQDSFIIKIIFGPEASPAKSLGYCLSLIHIIVINGVCYLGASGMQVLIWAMVNDSIDYHELQTGERNEGIVYSTRCV